MNEAARGGWNRAAARYREQAREFPENARFYEGVAERFEATARGENVSEGITEMVGKAWHAAQAEQE